MKLDPRRSDKMIPLTSVECEQFRSIMGLCATIPHELLLNHTTPSAILYEAGKNFPWKGYRHSFAIEVDSFIVADCIIEFYLKERTILPVKRWTAFSFLSMTPDFKTNRKLYLACQDLSDATMIKMQMPSADDELPHLGRAKHFR